MNYDRPDRNILIGAVTGVLIGLLTLGLEAVGITMPAIMIGELPVLVGLAVAHFIPQTQAELAPKIDNEAVKIAQADPDSPVNLAAVIDDKIVRQAQLDPTSDVSYVIPPVAVPAGEPPTIVPPADKGNWPYSGGEKV